MAFTSRGHVIGHVSWEGEKDDWVVCVCDDSRWSSETQKKYDEKTQTTGSIEPDEIGQRQRNDDRIEEKKMKSNKEK